MPIIEPIPMDAALSRLPRRDRGRLRRRALRHADPAAALRLQHPSPARDGRHPSSARERLAARRSHPRAPAHPQRAARRVPAVHAVAQARLDHRRGRRLSARRGRRRPHRAGAPRGQVHRPAVGRPPRHRPRLLRRAGRGVHRRADHRARAQLRRVDGHAPVHPHARGVRHRRAGRAATPPTRSTPRCSPSASADRRSSVNHPTAFFQRSAKSLQIRRRRPITSLPDAPPAETPPHRPWSPDPTPASRGGFFFVSDEFASRRRSVRWGAFDSKEA